MTMIGLAGATSFFVGNAFQAQMPEYAHHLGADEAGAWYSVLLAGNAAGAILGVLLLEAANVLRPNARAAIVCAGLWAVTIGLFPAAQSYVVAVALLVLAGVFNITFTSMAQTIVQMRAPPSSTWPVSSPAAPRRWPSGPLGGGRAGGFVAPRSPAAAPLRRPSAPAAVARAGWGGVSFGLLAAAPASVRSSGPST